MKTSYFIFVLAMIASAVGAQTHTSDLNGLWKISLKNSGGKMPPPPEFLLFKPDSSYIWGVDSLGQTGDRRLSTGKWLLGPDGEIELISSDTSLEARYYHPTGDGRFRLNAAGKGKSKERIHMLEMDIYIEKFR